MKGIWIHKARSFREAEQFDLSYYAGMSPSQRLKALQDLREHWWNLRKNKHGNSRKRLRRVLKIIKPK